MAAVTLVVILNSIVTDEINGTRMITDNAYNYTSIIGCISIDTGENLDRCVIGGSAININGVAGDINQPYSIDQLPSHRHKHQHYF